MDAISQGSVAYKVDAEGRLLLADPRWLILARQTGLTHESTAVPRPVPALAAVWGMLRGRARESRRPLIIPLRSDLSASRRLLEVELRVSAQRTVDHHVREIWSEPRPPVAWLRTGATPDEREFQCCAFCMRVAAGWLGRRPVWREIEDLADRTVHDRRGTVPQLIPGICAGCVQTVRQSEPARAA